MINCCSPWGFTCDPLTDLCGLQ